MDKRKENRSWNDIRILIKKSLTDGWKKDGNGETPISHEEYEDAKKGKWEVLLTPTRHVPHEWLGELKRKKRFLDLPVGVGQQMPIFSALGAKCTVLDYSSKQIESELYVAKREGYPIHAIEGDTDEKTSF